MALVTVVNVALICVQTRGGDDAYRDQPILDRRHRPIRP
jgi:hypothetical protein